MSRLPFGPENTAHYGQRVAESCQAPGLNDQRRKLYCRSLNSNSSSERNFRIIHLLHHIPHHHHDHHHHHHSNNNHNDYDSKRDNHGNDINDEVDGIMEAEELVAFMVAS